MSFTGAACGSFTGASANAIGRHKLPPVKSGLIRYYDGTAAGSIESDSSNKVASWRCAVSGIAVFQSVEERRPFISMDANRLNGIKFNPASSSAALNSPDVILGNSFTAIILATEASTAAGQFMIMNGNQNGNGWGFISNRSSGAQFTVLLGGSAFLSPGGVQAVGKSNLLIYSRPNHFSVNGVPVAVALATLNTPSGNGFTIGNQSNVASTGYRGTIHAVLIYNRPLLDFERNNIQAYLVKKHKLSLG